MSAWHHGRYRPRYKVGQVRTVGGRNLSSDGRGRVEKGKSGRDENNYYSDVDVNRLISDLIPAEICLEADCNSVRFCSSQ